MKENKKLQINGTMLEKEQLKKHLEKKDSVELLQFDKGSSSKKQGRLKYLLYINSNKFKKKKNSRNFPRV